MTPLPRGLYGMVDAAIGEPIGAIEERTRFLVDLGVAAVQLRAKGWPVDAVRRAAARLRPLVPILIVNDHVAVAVELDAWTHVGQGDGPAPSIPHGRSTHTLAELALALAPTPPTLAYVGFGPVFPTSTKDTGFDGRGTELLSEAVRRSTVPVVAIGGITPDNVDQVRATGAWAWAPISGFWAARGDPLRLRRLLHSG